MSEENVEVVRRSLEAWRRGDLEGLAETLDDDVVMRTAEGWPERAWHGNEAVRSFFDQYAQAVGHQTLIEEIVDAGAVVIVRLRAHLSGGESGIEGVQRFTELATLRKGKHVLVEFFWDHAEALEAAGLSE